MNRLPHKILGALLAVTVLSTTATAASLTWTFNDAYLQSALTAEIGQLTGTFDYDAYTHVYSNVSISSSGWSQTSDIDYLGATLTTPVGDNSSQLIVTGSTTTVAAYTDMMLQFVSPLSNAGGTVGMTVSSFQFAFGHAPRYYAILQPGATVSAVPVPAAVWLFGSALAGLGWMCRKQTV